MSLNLMEIRERLEAVKIKRAKGQERIASLEKQKKEIMDGLKPLGIKSEDEIEPRMAELHKGLSSLIKTLDDIEQGRTPQAQQPQAEARPAKAAKATEAKAKKEDDDIMKELGL